MKITYGWKVGSQIAIDPMKAGKEINSISNKSKYVTPDLIVSFASRNKDSELHKYFEWDNEIAGKKYRLSQASHLLRCITIEKIGAVSKGKKEIIFVRAFESVKNDNEKIDKKNIYVPVETALTVPEYRKNVQESIRNAIFALQEKARIYNSYLSNPSQFRDSLDSALKAV